MVHVHNEFLVPEISYRQNSKASKFLASDLFYNNYQLFKINVFLAASISAKLKGQYNCNRNSYNDIINAESPVGHLTFSSCVVETKQCQEESSTQLCYVWIVLCLTFPHIRFSLSWMNDRTFIVNNRIYVIILGSCWAASGYIARGKCMPSTFRNVSIAHASTLSVVIDSIIMKLGSTCNCQFSH